MESSDFIDGLKAARRQARVKRMCQAIVHRGPDDEGILAEEQVGLGMRRLSIDVAGGHQPIENEDGSVIVGFNGEIYNYQTLRADLLKPMVEDMLAEGRLRRGGLFDAEQVKKIVAAHNAGRENFAGAIVSELPFKNWREPLQSGVS